MKDYTVQLQIKAANSTAVIRCQYYFSQIFLSLRAFLVATLLKLMFKDFINAVCLCDIIFAP